MTKLYAIKNEKTGKYRTDQYGVVQVYTYPPMPNFCKRDEFIVTLVEHKEGRGT